MDNDRQEENRNPESETSRTPKNLNFWILLFIVGSLVAWLVISLQNFDYSTISYTYFKNLIEGRDYNGQPVTIDGEPAKFIESLEISDDGAYGTFLVIPDPEPSTDPSKQPTALKKEFFVRLPPIDQTRDEILQRLDRAGIQTKIRAASNATNTYLTLFVLISLGLLLVMFLSLRRAQNQMMGGGWFPFRFFTQPSQAI